MTPKEDFYKYHEDEDRKVFVYSPPPLYDPYIKLQHENNPESNAALAKKQPDEKKDDDNLRKNRFKGRVHRKLRHKYKFLFKPYDLDLDTTLAATMSWDDKKKRSEKKKQAKK